MKVLLASDASEPAEYAARFLSRFPHVEQLEVTVITSFELPSYALNETSGDWIAEYREIADEGTKYVRTKTEEIFANSTVSLNFVNLEGHPGNEIVTYAKRNKFDLVVLGATGHSTLSRILLGSVSDYVATHAPCSVLIVRPPKEPKLEGSLLNVTIGYDGSKQSRGALDEFSRFNWGSKVEIHVIHAAQSLYAYRERIQPASSSLGSLRNATTLEQLKLVARQLPFTEPDPQVHLCECEHTGQAIVDFASRANSDVVMLGDTGHSAIERMLLGSVSRYILRHAPMSVWIARTPKAS